MKKICVICGSNNGNNHIYKKTAKVLGDILVQNNFTLVYGGTNIGLMGEVANSVLKSGGKVIGVIPKIFFSKINNTNSKKISKYT